jgi:hypothetical protein
MVFGLLFGLIQWEEHAQRGEYASAGTVMLAALPLLIGVQLVLGFLNYDLQNTPTIPLQTLLPSDEDTTVRLHDC